MKYVKIRLHGGGSYIQPISELGNAINGELDGLSVHDKITIDIEPVDITDAEYKDMPEFCGH